MAKSQIAPADPPSAAQYADMTAENAMLKAKLAFVLENNQSTNYQLSKNAVTETGIPRETLRRWCNCLPPKVACYHDDQGRLWVDVIDARRVLFELARTGGQ